MLTRRIAQGVGESDAWRASIHPENDQTWHQQAVEMQMEVETLQVLAQWSRRWWGWSSGQPFEQYHNRFVDALLRIASNG